jgi:uncharacterized protein
MDHPVVHFEVSGKDAAKLQKFYADLFGWPVDANNPMNYGVVPKAEGGIGGGISPTPDGNTHVTFYVAAPDLQATLDKAEKLGGKTVNPPMDVPGGPKLAHFSDPAGNFVGIVWADPSQQQSEVTSPANPVAWFEIMGPDGGKLRKFYGDLFGWKIDADNPMNYGMVEADDGIPGGVGQTQDGGKSLTWYVNVPDVDATLKQAEGLGAKTLFGPDQVPEGPRIALIADPEGNAVGVMTMAAG